MIKNYQLVSTSEYSKVPFRLMVVGVDKQRHFMGNLLHHRPQLKQESREPH